MSESRETLPKKKKISRKTLTGKAERLKFKKFSPEVTENFSNLRVEADFENSEKTLRTEKLSVSKNNLRRSNVSAELALRVFTLLSRGRKPNAKMLVLLLLQRKFLTWNELKSLEKKQKVGRKPKILNKETGEILNMKEPFKTICESFNQGKEPEEIREIVIISNETKVFFPKKRTPKSKSEIISFILRILRRNKDFLTRPYGQK